MFSECSLQEKPTSTTTRRAMMPSVSVPTTQVARGGLLREPSEGFDKDAREHSGNIPEAFREYSGNFQGTFRDEDTSSRPTTLPVSSGDWEEMVYGYK
jgi:hypothetical protein